MELKENAPLSFEQLIQWMTKIEQAIKKLQRHDELMTKSETADYLKISMPTLDAWVGEGIIAAYRLGGRVYFKRCEIMDSLSRIDSAIGGNRKAA